MSRSVQRLALFAALAGVAFASAPGIANAEEPPTACELVSASRIEKAVRLPHALKVRESSSLDGTAGDQPAELPGAIHTECGWVLWSGSKPKSRAAVIKKAVGGQGAQVGVVTWAPNEASPNAEWWLSEGFASTTARFVKTRMAFLFHIPGKARSLNPHGEGYIGAGVVVDVTGIGKGLLAAIGCWWDLPSSRAICVLDEEAKRRPVVKHLNRLAKKLVPDFLGAP